MRPYPEGFGKCFWLWDTHLRSTRTCLNSEDAYIVRRLRGLSKDVNTPAPPQAIRGQLNLSQADFAGLMGVSVRTGPAAAQRAGQGAAQQRRAAPGGVYAVGVKFTDLAQPIF